MLDTYNQQIQEGVSCTITTNINTANHHFVVMEESQVINPLKGQSDNGWHFEQQVYDAEGIARAVKAGGGSGNIPKVIEPQVLTPKRTEFGKAVRKQYEAKEIYMRRHEMTTMEPRTDGITNTLTSVQKDNLVVTPRYRIRKLTPRECFRLQGVNDKDIDTLQNASISNSQLYKLAGNSITVDVLYHLFRKLFVDKGSELQQQTLF